MWSYVFKIIIITIIIIIIIKNNCDFPPFSFKISLFTRLVVFFPFFFKVFFNFPFVRRLYTYKNRHLIVVLYCAFGLPCSSWVRFSPF